MVLKYYILTDKEHLQHGKSSIPSRGEAAEIPHIGLRDGPEPHHHPIPDGRILGIYGESNRSTK